MHFFFTLGGQWPQAVVFIFWIAVLAREAVA